MRLIILALVCFAATGCVSPGLKLAQDVEANRVMQLESDIKFQKRLMQEQGEQYRLKIQHFAAMEDDLQIAVAQAVATKMADSDVAKLRNELAAANNRKDQLAEMHKAETIKQQQKLVILEAEADKRLANLKATTEKIQLERSEKVANAIGAVKDFAITGVQYAGGAAGGGGILAMIMKFMGAYANRGRKGFA